MVRKCKKEKKKKKEEEERRNIEILKFLLLLFTGTGTRYNTRYRYYTVLSDNSRLVLDTSRYSTRYRTGKTKKKEGKK